MRGLLHTISKGEMGEKESSVSAQEDVPLRPPRRYPGVVPVWWSRARLQTCEHRAGGDAVFASCLFMFLLERFHDFGY